MNEKGFKLVKEVFPLKLIVQSITNNTQILRDNRSISPEDLQLRIAANRYMTDNHPCSYFVERKDAWLNERIKPTDTTSLFDSEFNPGSIETGQKAISTNSTGVMLNSGLQKMGSFYRVKAIMDQEHAKTIAKQVPCEITQPNPDLYVINQETGSPIVCVDVKEGSNAKILCSDQHISIITNSSIPFIISKLIAKCDTIQRELDANKIPKEFIQDYKDIKEYHVNVVEALITNPYLTVEHSLELFMPHIEAFKRLHKVPTVFLHVLELSKAYTPQANNIATLATKELHQYNFEHGAAANMLLFEELNAKGFNYIDNPYIPIPTTIMQSSIINIIRKTQQMGFPKAKPSPILESAMEERALGRENWINQTLTPVLKGKLGMKWMGIIKGATEEFIDN